METKNNALATLEKGSIEYLMSMAAVPKNQIRREMDRNYLTLLKNSNPHLDDIYFIDFIHKCQITGADPRLNQIYLISHKSWNKDLGQHEYKGTVIFAYLFFVQMAQRTGQLEDWGVECVDDTYTDITTGKKKPSYTSTCWVKRKGQAKVTYTAYFWELAKTYNGNPTATWANSPKLMLNKCAVANAFRWAFPETLGSFYIQDEIKDAIDVEFTPMEPTAKPAPQPAEQVQQVQQIEQTAQQLDKETIEAETFTPERDIEDLRGELIEFLGNASPEFFGKLGKDKVSMLDKVVNTRTYSSMKTIYEICLAVK
jgi:phage recombination protein Bet